MVGADRAVRLELHSQLVARPPLFGAKVNNIKADAALAVPGVKAVVQIPQGVAVVARDFWAAKKGRDALVVEWDESGADKVSSDALRERYLELAKTAGQVAADRGDAAQALSRAARTLEATFTFPYLAHAPLEPLVCVVWLKDDAREIWAGSQSQTFDQASASRSWPGHRSRT